MEDSRPALAIDIGGTKLAAGLVEPGGRVLTWSQVPTPVGLDAEQLWRTLDALIGQIFEGAEATEADLIGCGCGCGGPMEWPAGLVSPLNIPAWRRFPLRSRLAERLGGIPVRVHNDAICLVAGEHWRGAGRGRRNVLGMVVSTGVGGGLVLDGARLGIGRQRQFLLVGGVLRGGIGGGCGGDFRGLCHGMMLLQMGCGL